MSDFDFTTPLRRRARTTIKLDLDTPKSDSPFRDALNKTASDSFRTKATAEVTKPVETKPIPQPTTQSSSTYRRPVRRAQPVAQPDNEVPQLGRPTSPGNQQSTGPQTRYRHVKGLDDEKSHIEIVPDAEYLKQKDQEREIERQRNIIKKNSLNPDAPDLSAQNYAGRQGMKIDYNPPDLTQVRTGKGSQQRNQAIARTKRSGDRLQEQENILTTSRQALNDITPTETARQAIKGLSQDTLGSYDEAETIPQMYAHEFFSQVPAAASVALAPEVAAIKGAGYVGDLFNAGTRLALAQGGTETAKKVIRGEIDPFSGNGSLGDLKDIGVAGASGFFGGVAGEAIPGVTSVAKNLKDYSDIAKRGAGRYLLNTAGAFVPDFAQRVANGESIGDAAKEAILPAAVSGLGSIRGTYQPNKGNAGALTSTEPTTAPVNHPSPGDTITGVGDHVTEPPPTAGTAVFPPVGYVRMPTGEAVPANLPSHIEISPNYSRPRRFDTGEGLPASDFTTKETIKPPVAITQETPAAKLPNGELNAAPTTTEIPAANAIPPAFNPNVTRGFDTREMSLPEQQSAAISDQRRQNRALQQRKIDVMTQMAEANPDAGNGQIGTDLGGRPRFAAGRPGFNGSPNVLPRDPALLEPEAVGAGYDFQPNATNPLPGLRIRPNDARNPTPLADVRADVAGLQNVPVQDRPAAENNIYNRRYRREEILTAGLNGQTSPFEDKPQITDPVEAARLRGESLPPPPPVAASSGPRANPNAGTGEQFLPPETFVTKPVSTEPLPARVGTDTDPLAFNPYAQKAESQTGKLNPDVVGLAGLSGIEPGKIPSRALTQQLPTESLPNPAIEDTDTGILNPPHTARPTDRLPQADRASALNGEDQLIARIQGLPEAERNALINDPRLPSGISEIRKVLENRTALTPEQRAALPPKFVEILDSIPKLTDVSTSGALRGLADFPGLQANLEDSIAAQGGQELPPGKDRNLMRADAVYKQKPPDMVEPNPDRSITRVFPGNEVMASNRAELSKQVASKYPTKAAFIDAVGRGALDPATRETLRQQFSSTAAGKKSAVEFSDSQLGKLYDEGAGALQKDSGYQPGNIRQVRLGAGNRETAPPEFNAPISRPMGKEAPPAFDPFAKTGNSGELQPSGDLNENIKRGDDAANFFANMEGEEAKPAPPKLTDQVRSWADRIEEEGKAYLDEAHEQRKKERNSGAPPDPKALAALAKIGAAKIARGLANFADFSQALLKEYGGGIKPYLQDIYNAANDLFLNRPTKDLSGRQMAEVAKRAPQENYKQERQIINTRELKPNVMAETIKQAKLPQAFEPFGPKQPRANTGDLTAPELSPGRELPAQRTVPKREASKYSGIDELPINNTGELKNLFEQELAARKAAEQNAVRDNGPVGSNILDTPVLPEDFDPGRSTQKPITPGEQPTLGGFSPYQDADALPLNTGDLKAQLSNLQAEKQPASAVNERIVRDQSAENTVADSKGLSYKERFNRIYDDLLGKENASGRTPILKRVAVGNKAAILASAQGLLNDFAGTTIGNIVKDAIEAPTASKVDALLARLPHVMEDNGQFVRSDPGRRTVGEAGVMRIARSLDAIRTQGFKDVHKSLTSNQYDFNNIFSGTGKIARGYDFAVNGLFKVRGIADNLSKAYAMNSAMESIISREAMNAKRDNSPITEDALHKMVKTYMEGGKLDDFSHQYASRLVNEGATTAIDAIFAADNKFSTFIHGIKEDLWQNKLNVRGKEWKADKDWQRGASQVTAFMLEHIAPFTKIPSNIIKQGLAHYNPVAAGLRIGAATKRSVQRGGLTMEDQAIIARAAGKGMLGTSMLLLGAMAAKAGMANSSIPFNPFADDKKGERNRNKAANRDAGTVRIPGTDYRMPTSVFGSLGQVFNMGVELYQKPTLETGLEQVFDLGLEHPIGRATKEAAQTFFTPGGTKKEVARWAGSFVPKFVSELQTPLNYAVRGEAAKERMKRDAGKDFLGGLADEFTDKVPIVRENKPVRPTALGDVNEKPGLGAFLPFKQERRSPLLDRLDKFNVDLSETQRKPGESDADYSRRATATGKNLKRNLDILTRSSVFSNASPEDRKELNAGVEKFSRRPDKEGMLHKVDPHKLREALSESKMKKKMEGSSRRQMRIAPF